MKTIVSRRLLLPLLAAAPLVAGCGASVSVGSITIDHDKAQKMLVDGITGGTVAGRSATCPTGVDAEKGKTFDCTVTWENGATATATVHIISDEGEIRFTARDLTEPVEPS
jgi:hypothetical protein